ncbi:MAG: D-alanine--D-alanine ligase, partial [Eubacteriaceae bacterium]|nr:D-alanine--D-alanine ligase [Eubacteriaceae bacterium]
MQKKKVAIIFGGCSSEYEVSLQSAHAVISNIDNKKYEPLLIGITKEGRWYRYYGKITKISDNTWHKDSVNCVEVVLSPNRGANELIEFKRNEIVRTVIDCAFPILHGKFGEDGTVQGLIELAGIALVGCNTLSSALCMDKDRAHKIAAYAGIKIPKSIVINKSDTKDEIVIKAQKLKFPLFIKPVKAGSSFGISKITNIKHLEQAVINAFLYDDEVIIEENIDGTEVGCAVLGNDELIVGKVDEIELAGGFFDYDEKYTLKTSKIHMPARVDEKTEER